MSSRVAFVTIQLILTVLSGIGIGRVADWLARLSLVWVGAQEATVKVLDSSLRIKLYFGVCQSKHQGISRTVDGERFLRA